MHKICTHNTCTHTHTHTHTHTYTHTYTHTHIHTHVSAHPSHLNVLYAYHKTFGLLPCTFVTALDNVVTNQTFLHASPLVKNALPVGNCSGTPGDWADQLLSVLQRLLADVDNILHTHLILMDMTNTSGVESLTWWIQ